MTSTASGGFVTLLGRLRPLDDMFSHLAQERPAPGADRQEGGEDHHGVDARPTGPGPVDVLKVEPQGELVEGQRGSDPVCDRGYARQPVGAAAYFDKPDIPDDQEQEDAPHEVMDVKATTGDVVKGPDTHPDEVGDGTHDRERHYEAYRGEEEPLPALVAEMKAVDPLEGGHLW